MRKFEKVSLQQYMKNIGGDIDLTQEYNDIIMPYRKTKYSAGYDIHSPFSFQLQPKEIITIPTGIRVMMNEDEVLKIYVRSSVGFKYTVNLVNSTGIIDADYYYADNEGHIMLRLINNGNKIWEVEKGNAIAQGIFEKYLVTDDDDKIEKADRTNGIGSTGR